MCNLYSMTATVDEMRRLFGAFESDRDNLPAYPEIYPGKPAPVLFRDSQGALRLAAMSWGFPGPAAAKGRPVTNIRNLASPFWRSALDRPDRRCLVPVTRFCEWSVAADPATGSKVRHWFGLHHHHDAPRVDRLFAFAGLWRPDGGADQSGPYMAFLTCAPNAVVGAVHPKAMPVMLAPDDGLKWLDGDRASACALARPWPDADMRMIEPA